MDESASERLTGVEVEQEGDATIVTLLGLQSPVYTVTQDVGSGILVVDLFDVEGTDLADGWEGSEADNPIQVFDGLVDQVAVSSHTEDGEDASTRVEVELASDADYEIEVGSQGLSLRMWATGLEGDSFASGSEDGFAVDGAEDDDTYWSADAESWDGEALEDAAPEMTMAAMTPASKLLAVEHEITENGVILHLKADGAIETTETLTLENPDRLVIDLPGIKSDVAKAAVSIDSGQISKVRLGQHADKLRVVVDGGAEAESFAARSMTPVADGLYVTVGSGSDLEDSLAQGIARSNEALMVAVEDAGTGESDSENQEVSWADDGQADDDAPAWDAESEVAEEWDIEGDSDGEIEIAEGWETESETAEDAEADVFETSAEEAAIASAEPVDVFGVNFDASAERDRIAILSEAPVEYELFTPEPETVVISIRNAVIDPAAQGHIERQEGGPTSLISAFQQPDVEDEVRVVVTRAPNLEPVIVRRGTMLFVDFPNTGLAAAQPPAFGSSHAAVVSQIDMSADAGASGITIADGELAAGDSESLVELDGTAAASEIELADGSLATAQSQDETAFEGPASLDTNWVPAAAEPADAAAPAQAAAPASLEPPAAIEILEEGGLIDGKTYSGRRISLDFKDVAVADVLRLIAEVSDLNIIAGSEVSGAVTIRLVDVPWDQALDVVLLTRGLGFVRVGNVLRIAPADVLKVEEEVRLQERRNREKLEDLEVKLIPINYARVKDVVGMVTRLLSARGTVDVDGRTNTLIMKDIVSVIDEASALIQALDTETPQVVIEAKIVEAGLDFRRELGSEWGIQTNQFEDAYTGSGVRRTLGGEDFRFIGENSLSFSNPISSSSTAAMQMGALLLDEDFAIDVAIQAAESSGDGKVISSPRVVTLDNRPAKISQGVSIPFQTFEGGDAKLEFIDAVLSLEVTPHITANKSVIMKVAVTRNAPDDSVATPTGSPAIAKNEATTETLVRDGQTMVLGGIYTITKSERMSRVPYLHRIPIIGVAFRNKSVTDARKELLVFVTPRVVQ
jgi:type IV pilus assembly protein PilQ